MNATRLCRLGSLILASLLAGCGTDIGNLRPVTDGRKIEVVSEYVRLADASSLACKYLITYRVSPGFYGAEFSSNAGTYYRAPSGAIRVERRHTPCGEMGLPPVDLVGGIFVPNDRSKPVLLYRYLGAASETNLDAATSDRIARTAAPNASPVASGIGQGVASAMIGAASAIESDNLMFLPDQAKDGSLRALIIGQ